MIYYVQVQSLHQISTTCLYLDKLLKALRKALADYTANVSGRNTDHTVDKEDFIYGKDFVKLALLQTAANAVSDSRESMSMCIWDIRKWRN